MRELQMKLQGTSGGGAPKVKELETKLLETRMLYTTTIDDYDIVSAQYKLILFIIGAWLFSFPLFFCIAWSDS